jgi:hypothetical protein
MNASQFSALLLHVWFAAAERSAAGSAGTLLTEKLLGPGPRMQAVRADRPVEHAQRRS